MSWAKLWRLPKWLYLIILISLFVSVFGIFIHVIEPVTFPTFWEGAWWVLITISTVGYGDYAPASAAGRWLTVLIILLGAGLISSYFFTIASSAFIRQQALEDGTRSYTGRNHIILIGWNARTSWLLEQYASKAVVLIDDSLEKHPLLQTSPCQFIKGKPYYFDTLKKASLSTGSAVIITANQHVDEEAADAQTVLTLLTIRRLHPTIPCIVELLTHEHVDSAKKAGATTIVESHATVGRALTDSLSQLT
ncbi:potassium channel family protein [Jeotgalibacillus sp. ET6]|uniref:potassium channel family protein n=1 Tax=Jeotgalibacillus sp. ET6 TaxID=3037260 RepID=UPI0024185450|nr:potassium channel family protein [Jeotgalibacillus sp. ET6]MDG5471830.1 potassium channel family protein [Jeotgalibacillus sp. ET6]